MQHVQQQQATAKDALPTGILPGKAWMALTVVLSFVLCCFWLLPGLHAMSARSASDAGSAELAFVADSDIDGALATMNGAPLYLSQFKRQTSGCPTPLAWVSVVRDPASPAATIRIQSGPYVSPVFDLAPEPRRIAIPYPAPYETGRGNIVVQATGTGATIALIPSWRLPPNTPAMTHAVIWPTTKRCARPNG